MKKKFLIIALAVVSAVACMFGIAGCIKKPDSNDGNDGNSGEQGSGGHVHEYGSWTVTKEATCSEEGSHERTCAKCDYTQIETIAKKGHKFKSDNVCSVCNYELEYTTGLAYEEYTESRETYYSVTGMGTATDKDLVIPAYHAGKEVKKIAPSAFSGKDALTSVYIANGIEQIGEKAFEYCTSIKEVTLPESLNKSLTKYSNGSGGTVIGYYNNIGANAFYGCQKLTDITLPDRGIIIGECAFEGTAYFKNVKNWDKGVLYIGNHLIATNKNFTATSYTVSKDIVSIADKAFYGESILNEFIISEGAYPRIGDNALKASGITKAEVSNKYDNQLKYLSASNITDLTVNGKIYKDTLSDFVNVKTLVVNGEIMYMYDHPLSGLGKLENLTVEAYLYSNSLSDLFGKTYYEGSTKVEQCIGPTSSNPTYETYYFPSNLRNITILSGTIGEYAFSCCNIIQNVTICDGVTSVDKGAFYKCSGLTTVTIGNGVTGIDEKVFEGCSELTSITLGEKIKVIQRSSFIGCDGIKSINYTGDIGGWCGINGLRYMPSCTLLIGGKELAGELVIPDSVTYIAERAFYGCSKITSITIPDSVKSIGSDAFYGCSKITSITIPDGVTRIGSDAFGKCSGLTSITVKENNTSYKSMNNCLLTKDGETLVLGCKNSIIPDNVTSIGSYAFRGCSGLKNIKIPDDVTSIGSYAFFGCSGLTSVTIPDGVTSIGSGVFSGCSGLTSITIPNGVTSIGEYAFSGCSGLTDIKIPNGVTSIGSSTFSRCSGLISIIIPDSVTSIGSSAFEGCSGLEIIYCEVTEQPSGWSYHWRYNADGLQKWIPVVWGYKDNDDQ